MVLSSYCSYCGQFYACNGFYLQLSIVLVIFLLMHFSLFFLLRNGASKSGVFVAMSLLLERLDLDYEVDVYQTVKQIRINRPQFIENLVSSLNYKILKGNKHLMLLSVISESYPLDQQ